MTARDPNANAFAPVRASLVGRRLFTEALGTFFMIAVDSGGAMLAVRHGVEVTSVARALAIGLLMSALIAAMGDVSGAHFNPSVTLAFALRSAFPWKMVPAYWLAQLVGAIAASFMLRAIFGDVANIGRSEACMGWRAALAMEILLTTLRIVVSVSTATRHRVLGANAALAVGFAIAACALVGRPVSGASMNPVREIGPALASGDTRDLWLYVVAPFIASFIAWGVVMIVHTKHHEEERAAASGEPK